MQFDMLPVFLMMLSIVEKFRYVHRLNVEHWFVLNTELVDHYPETFVGVMVVKSIVDVRIVEMEHVVPEMEWVWLISMNDHW